MAADHGQGSKEFHVVYASPGTIDAYRRDGRFSDGAVLVKEVFRAATEQMTTGAVSHADTLKGWFVMMKDSNGRYSGNKLWGDGLGLVVVRCCQSVKDDIDRLQNRLPGLSCAGASVRLGLCRWISSAETVAMME